MQSFDHVLPERTCVVNHSGFAEGKSILIFLLLVLPSFQVCSLIAPGPEIECCYDAHALFGHSFAIGRCEHWASQEA